MAFNIFNWYRDYQLRKLQLQLEAKNAPYQAIQSVVENLATVSTSQTKILQEWISQFKTSEIPTSSIVREVDEYQMEQDRIREVNGQLPNNLSETIRNALKAGAFPDLQELTDQ